MKAWVGIDGGGTRATAVAVDRDGGVLARVEGGAALVDPLQPQRGAQDLADLARRALTEARVTGRATGLCCALAGAGRQSVRDLLMHDLQQLDIADHVIVTSDAEAAITDAFAGGPGALLIAGTGSVAYARDASGTTVRAGGWGMLLDDEGSGYSIGMSALRSVVRAADSRDKATVLTTRVLAALGLELPEDLIAWTAGATKADIAALAPVVTTAAAENDRGAMKIVSTAATELVLQVHAVLDRSGPWSSAVPVAFAGGLISPGRPLRDRTWRALQSLPYGFHLREEPVDAARGAAHIARSAC